MRLNIKGYSLTRILRNSSKAEGEEGLDRDQSRQRVHLSITSLLENFSLLEKIRRRRMAAVLNLQLKVDADLKAFLAKENRPLHGKTGATLEQILESIFANIAVQGTSEHTEFLDLTVEVKSMEDQSTLGSYNLREVVNLIKAFKTTSSDPNISGMTFRQVCEAFAPEARNGLVKLKYKGVFTNLFTTMPEVGGKYPELMFDFNKGLNMFIMNKAQQKVITNMNRRLLQTEFAKNESEAKISSVSTDLCI
uniref:28K protein n=2 Tax=Trichovirus mali TaxID=12175 RepID=O12660_9VIRU|nr:28K protein [Apple chlorotic leaf spot virus]